MKRASMVLLAALVAVPAMAQAPQKPAPAAAPVPGAPATVAATPSGAVACGPLRGSATRNGAGTQWTIDGPAGKTIENGALRSGPRFECLDGKVLVVEFTSTAGHSFFEAYFADGTTIGYGRQQIDKRGNRFVLPVQAKARIAEPYRGLFDYHCKLNMPADPIPPAARADCPS